MANYLKEEYDFLEQYKKMTNVFSSIRSIAPYVWDDDKNLIYFSRRKMDLIYWLLKVVILGILGPILSVFVIIYIGTNAKNLTQFELFVGIMYASAFTYTALVNILEYKFKMFPVVEIKGLYDLDAYREKLLKEVSENGYTWNIDSDNGKKLHRLFANIIKSLSNNFILLVLTWYFMITYDYPPLNRINTGSHILNFLISFMGSYFGYDGLIALVLVAETGLTHLYFVNKWMEEIQTIWDPRMSDELKWKFHVFWRAIYSQHYYIRKGVANVAPFVIPTLVFMIIISLFTLIRLDQPFIIRIFVLNMNVGLLVTFHGSCVQMYKVIEGSENIKNMLKTERNLLKTSKLDIYRFRSYQTLKFTIGFNETIPVHKMLTLVIMQDFILDQLINLLVSIE